MTQSRGHVHLKVPQMACKGQQRFDSETCSDERRRNRRLNARLDILVRLPNDEGGLAPVERTCTENISSGDMYFQSSLADRLSVGDLIDVEIELPVRTSTIFTEKRLEARGRVARIGEPSIEEPNRLGVAIVFLKPPAFHRTIA